MSSAGSTTFEMILIHLPQLPPMKSIAFLLASLLVLLTAHAGEVYKWTDSQGVTHYGDKPSADPKLATKRMNIDVHALSEDEQKEVDARLAADRAKLRASSPPALTAPGIKPPAAAAPKAPQSECARQWKVFNDDARCWDPQHRFNADKAAHPERYEYCMKIGNFKGVVAPTCPEPIR